MSETDGRQDEQAKLMAEGKKIPGVAEALAVYGEAVRHAPAVMAWPVPQTVNATSTNM